MRHPQADTPLEQVPELLEHADMLVTQANTFKEVAGDHLRKAMAPIVEDLIEKLGIDQATFASDSGYDDQGNTYTSWNWEWTLSSKDGAHQFLTFNDGAALRSLFVQCCAFQCGLIEHDIDPWAGGVQPSKYGPEVVELFSSLLINQLDESPRSLAYRALEWWLVVFGKGAKSEDWYWDGDRSEL